MNRISAAENLIIENNPDEWRLLAFDENGSETEFLRVVSGYPIRYNLSFANTRRLPTNGILPLKYVRQVVLGWSHEDDAWHLGMIFGHDIADVRGSRWCSIARWPDPDPTVFEELAHQAASSLATLLDVPFHRVAPRPPEEELQNASFDLLAANSTQTPIPTPNFMIRIGVVAGHSGPENDPGAVCPDGLTEAEINFAVAEMIWIDLLERGYTVDLLEEYDIRAQDYQADLLVSIHANDCQDYGEPVSGFLVSQHDSRPDNGLDAQLVDCIVEHYRNSSGLAYRPEGVTPDMLEYHIFNRINLNTPAAIVELGFMKDDREVLTQNSDALAEGVVNGILCYLGRL